MVEVNAAMETMHADYWIKAFGTAIVVEISHPVHGFAVCSDVQLTKGDYHEI